MGFGLSVVHCLYRKASTEKHYGESGPNKILPENMQTPYPLRRSCVTSNSHGFLRRRMLPTDETDMSGLS